MAGTQRDTSEAIEEQPRRGRPPGEVDPLGLIKQELIAHLRLYKRTREIVERRLADDLLDPDTLAKLMDLLRKGIADLSRPFVAAAKPEAVKATEEEDGEKILARLLEGK